MKQIFFLIFIILFTLKPAFANDLCGQNCNFEHFFKQNYAALTGKLCLNEEKKRIFDIIFNAYSIKFQGLDFEYQNRCKELHELDRNCRKEIKKEIINLTEIAMEEYDSFLEDLNFEICGDENSHNKIINKNKKRYRRPFKRLVMKNCR